MDRSLKSKSQKKSMFFVSVMAMLVLVLAACSPAAAPTQAVPVTGPTVASTVAAAAPTMAPTTAAGGAEPVVNVATDPKLGKILVDGKGMTLYMFTKDTDGKSTCAGGCLAAWPPLLTTGSAKAGDGVDASLLGVTATTDGKQMVTYNKLPLYYWKGDAKPGDVNGQNVNNAWFVVDPSGKPVGMQSAAPTTAAAGSSETMINVATDAKLGKFLVDGKGMTLYMFTKDEANKSNCTDKCLQAWPPLKDTGSVKAGDGVDQSLIGSAALPDGSKVVTYNKMPLYHFAKDTKPGDVTGQDVNSVWYVVSPDGKKVDPEDSTSSSSASPASADDVKIMVGTDAKLGKILVDGKGMALYMFAKDGPNQSNCKDKCLTAWPPLKDNGKVKAEDGVDQSLIGSAALPDGSKIVTYNKMPLYYWAGDTAAGQTTGQGVNGVWFVVSPDGKPVKGETPTGY